MGVFGRNLGYLGDGSGKSIYTVNVDDLVIGENGLSRRVTHTYKYKYTGMLKKIFIGNSNVPIVCTPQHEIEALIWPHKRRPTTKLGRNLAKDFYNSSSLAYQPASTLKVGDCLVTPRYQSKLEDVVIDLADYIEATGSRFYKHDDIHIWNTWRGDTQGSPLPRFIRVDANFMRLAGFFVSEGGVGKNGKNTHFTLGNHGQDSPCLFEIERLLHTIFGETTHIRREQRRSTSRIVLCSRIINAMMGALFGTHTLSKKVPSWFKDLTPELLYNFLDTAFWGDGSKTIRRRLDYSTCSESLAYQLRFMLGNLGYTVQFQRRVPKPDKRGRKANVRYSLYIAGDQIVTLASHLPTLGKSVNLINYGNSGIRRLTHIDDAYLYSRIKRIEEVSYEGFVHDLSIEGHPSYVVEAKVHNSPPAYLGHRETIPVLSAERLYKYHTPTLPLTILLLDEIEKASDALWQLLLGILDDGTITLGSNETVDMSCCLIVMTANVGASEMSALTKENLGFKTGRQVERLSSALNDTAINAAKKKFTPEFMNRIDKIVVFNTLKEEHLEKILDLELEALQLRILRAQTKGKFNPQFVFGCTPEVKALLLREGYSPEYGARFLKRTIQRRIVFPLSNLITTQQIQAHDFILLSLDEKGQIQFTVDAENATVPILLERFATMGLGLAKNLPEPVTLAHKKLKEAEAELSRVRKMREELAKHIDEIVDPYEGEKPK